jgi:O-antigen/teichoic acid export membrane protein
MPAAFLSRLLSGLATLFTARELGPAGFGQASVILATTLWIQVPLFLGLPTALMRFIPVAKPVERESWLATGLSLLAFSGGGTLIIGFTGSRFFASLQGVTQSEFESGLLWCATFLFFTVAAFVSAARERFHIRAALEVVFAALFLAQILVLWFFKNLDASAYVKAMAAAYALVGIVGLFFGRPGRFDLSGFRGQASALLTFGLIASGGSIAGALLQSVGRLIANRYLDLSQVGQLAAYQAASLQMALYFLTFGLHVFVPVAARTPDRNALFRKLTRLSVPVVAGTAVVCAAVLAAYFLVLGRRYHLGMLDLVMFALASGLAAQHGILSWFFSSGSRRGLVAAVTVSLIAGVLNALLGWLWIPRWGVSGAALAAGAGYAGGILACYLPGIRRYGTS